MLEVKNGKIKVIIMKKIILSNLLGNPAIQCRCQPAGQQIQRRLQQPQPDSL